MKRIGTKTDTKSRNITCPIYFLNNVKKFGYVKIIP